MPKSTQANRVLVPLTLVFLYVVFLANIHIAHSAFSLDLRFSGLRHDLEVYWKAPPAARAPVAAATDSRFPPARTPEQKSCVALCVARQQPPTTPIVRNTTCTAESKRAWCSVFYTPQVIEAVCTLMCNNQHPVDCAQADYLVLNKDWSIIAGEPAGIGSTWHIRMIVFVAALEENRVFMYDPDLVSEWTYPEDPFAPCAARHPDCYFAPVTHCTLPADWRSRAKRFTHNCTEQVCTTSSRSKFFRMGRKFDEASVPVNLPAVLRGMSKSWWKGQFAPFLFSPHPEIVRADIIPAVQKVFKAYEGPGLLPEKYVCVFARRGDKIHERHLPEYVDMIRLILKACAEQDIRHVYLNSDANEAIVTVRNELAKVRPDIGFYWIENARPDKGSQSEVMAKTQWNQRGIRTLMNQALTDFYIAQRATYWIGTISSNTCRLQNEFRLASGRHGSPFVSLDWSQYDPFNCDQGLWYWHVLPPSC